MAQAVWVGRVRAEDVGAVVVQLSFAAGGGREVQCWGKVAVRLLGWELQPV